MSKGSPKILDPFSPEGLREAVSQVLAGANYRMFFEAVTRNRLLDAYQEVAKHGMRKGASKSKWKQAIKKRIAEGKTGDAMRYWLLGLTRKTVQNLGVKPSEYDDVFDQLMEGIEKNKGDLDQREAVLMVWGGAATLTIRGSAKAQTGKLLEKAVVRPVLTLLGLDEAKGDFTLDLRPDAQVSRQIDAEIRTPRGVVQMEVGLIGEGNPEVINDKINRVGKSGVVMFDKISPNSQAWQEGEAKQVKLIQMRNSNPVEELRLHLAGLNVPVLKDPIPHDQIASRVRQMDLGLFKI